MKNVLRKVSDHYMGSLNQNKLKIFNCVYMMHNIVHLGMTLGEYLYLDVLMPFARGLDFKILSL